MGTGFNRNAALAASAIVLLASAARGAQTFYVDPENGSMNNDGSAAAPWRTLAEVVASKLVRIKGGDTILLRSGYHGEVQLSGAYNDEVVTVKLPLGAHGEMHCTTCHDPHNNELGDFLRISDQMSAICVSVQTGDLKGSISAEVVAWPGREARGLRQKEGI